MHRDKKTDRQVSAVRVDQICTIYIIDDFEGISFCALHNARRNSNTLYDAIKATLHKPESAFEPRKQIEIHKMFMRLEQFFIFYIYIYSYFF